MVDTAGSWHDLIEAYSFRGITDARVYIDETCRRMLPLYVGAFAETAQAMYADGKSEKAKALVDRAFEVLPPRVVGWGDEWLSLVALLYELGDREKAHAALMDCAKEHMETRAFERTLKPGLRGVSSVEIGLARFFLGKLQMLAKAAKDSEAQAAIDAVLEREK